MKRNTKIMIALLAIFIAGTALGTAFAQNTDIKTFKTSNGYEWKIKNETWETMKKEAAIQYNKMRDIGSITPGYSDSINITVTKGTMTFHGIAMAVKNDCNIRCEVRGVLPDGEHLCVNETDVI